MTSARLREKSLSRERRVVQFGNQKGSLTRKKRRSQKIWSTYGQLQKRGKERPGPRLRRKKGLRMNPSEEKKKVVTALSDRTNVLFRKNTL